MHNLTNRITKSFAFILLFSVAACGQQASKQDSAINNTSTHIGWKTLDRPVYSIQYPSAWELNQSGLMGTSFFLFSSLESEQDKFKENVNLLIQDLSGKNIDLNTYAQLSEGQIKTMITNSTMIESKRIKKGGVEYHRVIYTGDQGALHLKFQQHYLVIGEKAYILTFTSEQAKFEDFKEISEKILNSFKLKS